MPEIELQYPYALLLLLLLPGLPWLSSRARKKLPFPNVGDHLRGIQPGFWKTHYETLLCSVALILLCLALANPGFARKTVEEFIESKWIMLTLDLSGSMMRQAGRQSDRTVGDVALDGLETFIELRQPGDYIGLVAFSSFARLLSPLTFDRELLKRKLELVRSKNRSRIYRELGAGGGTNASEAVWLAISVFLSMLPEENRLTPDELADLRTFLLGEPGTLLDVPAKLKKVDFGTGMAVILFTDGRIEPRLRAHTGQAGLPNLVNLITLMKTLGIRFYIIAVGGQVDEAVEEAMTFSGGDGNVGRIFPLSRDFDPGQVREVYKEIDDLESNRLLVRVSVQPLWTRNWLILAALLLILIHTGMRTLPGYRRI
ncbi:MAG: VWA domain-containing protein [Syntrophotaleaceae bacterium]